MTAKILSQLLPAVGGARLVRGDADTLVLGIGYDTRRLSPGELFVAVPGFRVNGLAHVPQALGLGACAIVAEEEPAPAATGSTPIVLVPSARAALADLSGAFYDHPSRRLDVVGVTGTDGKTTITHLLSAVLEAAGRRTGWLTTVSTKVAAQQRPNALDHTTPEAPIVQGTLAEMVAAGVDVAIVETSSHALALGRVAGTRFRVGVFSNLSPEHLNFHGSLAAYREAKSRLFAMLPPDGLAVLNADDPSSDAMRAASRARVVSYGFAAAADVRAADVVLGARGSTFRLVAADAATGSLIQTHLVGRFNVANWLAAYAAAAFFGATPDDVRRAAELQRPIPGRMTLVDHGQPFPVVVDFAHTPQALEKALETVRELVPGRVLLVFGLAGGRDFHNRGVMGALAARLSDYVVITMDDPGDEDPGAIARQIASGAEAADAREGDRFAIQLDRRAAIRAVLARARPTDVVLLAGKGHENRMVVAGGRLPWNEAAVAGDELSRLGFSPHPVP